MAIKNTQARRLVPERLQKAKEGLVAISQLTGYAPQRTEFSAAIGAAIETNLAQKQRLELEAFNNWEAARDASAAVEWEAYNFMLGAGEQVASQYGSDSDAFASIGYKKKSEYKKTHPRKTQPKGGSPV